MALVYSLKVNMISGARYQRVATYSVMKPELSSVEAADRARPKSHSPMTGRREGRFPASTFSSRRSLPAISAGEPLVGIFLGVLVFGDRIQITPGELALQAGGIVALIVGGIVGLIRYSDNADRRLQDRQH